MASPGARPTPAGGAGGPQGRHGPPTRAERGQPLRAAQPSPGGAAHAALAYEIEGKKIGEREEEEGLTHGVHLSEREREIVEWS